MDGVTRQASGCAGCGTPLHAFSPPEGWCRPCRARLLGLRTARAYLEPIPYGRVDIECVSCAAPALLCAVTGLEQALPATLGVHYRCIRCDLLDMTEVQLIGDGTITVVGWSCQPGTST